MSKAKSTPSATVKILCSYSKLEDPLKLKPTDGNPNSHPSEQIAEYKHILEGLGFRKAIIVSNQTGRIVTGHGAWIASKEMRLPKVPVDYQDFESEDVERAFMLADNQLGTMSQLDLQKAELLMAEFSAEFDKSLTAFKPGDFAASEVKLKKLEVRAAPAMSWVLIGVPTVKFGEISEAIERIASRHDSVVETTVT